jgi:hypothetical protein
LRMMQTIHVNEYAQAQVLTDEFCFHPSHNPVSCLSRV